MSAPLLFDVEVDGIASSGAGVGRLPEGRAVFVHRTAPGEKVRIRLTREKKRWAEGRLVEILDRSPERREAPCPHYDHCGGCTLEHLGYEAQRRWKGRIVADALERIGGISRDVPEVVASPEEFRYRSRITLALRRLGGDRVVAGFHELDRPGRIVDLGGECLLPDPAIARVWDDIREQWGPGARTLPGGRELRLTLRSLDSGVLLEVEEGRGAGDLPELLRRVEGLVAAWRIDEGGAQEIVGPEVVTEEFLGESVEVRGGAFLQVNRMAGEALQRRLLDVVGDPADLDIVDGYCGLGVVGRILAREGARVTGIELDPAAVQGARAGAPPGQQIVAGRVEDELPKVLPADVAVLNPPRQGLDRRIPGILARSGPDRIIYVSCDPATLARDLKRLTPAYHVASLEAYDLFPQTAHIEVLTVLERAELRVRRASPDGADSP